MKKYILFFSGLVLTSLSIYLAILYGLHIPAKNRYDELHCTPLNSTHGTANSTLCKNNLLLFNQSINGTCFYDKKNNLITEFPVQWESLLIIAGSNLIIFILIFLVAIVSKLKK